MRLTPIFNAIESTVKADATAAELLKLYRHRLIEPGAMAVPILLIGSSVNVQLNEEFTGAHDSTTSCIWRAVIGISILTRGYPLPAQVARAQENVDAAQSAVYNALNNDSDLSGAVMDTDIAGIKEIALMNGEYYGYQILLTCMVFEP
jgi:hypothetical protein